MLECGIEILAQPPGKRLASVAAACRAARRRMSAIALLFAIFRYQPSPFCLLDEVDAALDDLNVGRFTRMLREYARHDAVHPHHAQQAAPWSRRTCSTA